MNQVQMLLNVIVRRIVVGAFRSLFDARGLQLECVRVLYFMIGRH